MRSLFRRRWFWLVAVSLLLFGGGGAFYLLNRPPPDRRAFWPIQSEWSVADHERDQAMRPGNSAQEQEEARAEYAARQEALAQRCLQLADRYPDSTGEIAALLLASKRAANIPAGKEALSRLIGRVDSIDIEHLARPFDWVPGPSHHLTPLAQALLARARKDADHPKAARLLTAVCTITRPRDEPQPPAIFVEAADLLAARYADSPDIVNFCECLNNLMGGDKPWAGRYEPHLRKVLELNQDRRVRSAATVALASVVQSAGEERLPEAEGLYEKFLDEFDGKHRYSAQGIEQEYRRLAKGQLDEIRSRGVGKPAPDIDGVDLDGKPMKLSEHRGKVVLLNFWATTCFPCMKLVPHERELVARMQGKPFALVGVTEDAEAEKARKTAAKHQMTWRTFQNKRAGQPTISEEWKVLGLPTLYLIDHKGMVRKRWIGAPPAEELGSEVDQLVAQASRGA